MLIKHLVCSLYNLNVAPQFCVPASEGEPQLQRVEYSLTDDLLHAFPDAADRDRIEDRSRSVLGVT